MSTISDRIKYIRQNVSGKKMSQDDFGRELGLSRSMIANIEDAENRLPNGIPESTLKLISKTFHVDYRWLVDETGDMLVPSDPEDLVDKYMKNETPLTKSIMKAFAKLPDEEWIRLRDMIDKIKKEATL